MSVVSDFSAYSDVSLCSDNFRLNEYIMLCSEGINQLLSVSSISVVP